MKIHTFVAMIIAAPILALFGGVGILAWNVGETWTEAQTSALVMGVTTVCGGGALVMGILVAFIVGIPLAIRLLGDLGTARRAWDVPIQGRDLRALPPARQWQEERPPMLEAKPDNMGSWQTSQGAQYDLWEEEPVEADWGN